MLFKEIYEAPGIRTPSHSVQRTFGTRLNAKSALCLAALLGFFRGSLARSNALVNCKVFQLCASF
jgi:hypothetical protein